MGIHVFKETGTVHPFPLTNIVFSVEPGENETVRGFMVVDIVLVVSRMIGIRMQVIGGLAVRRRSQSWIPHANSTVIELTAVVG